MSKGLVHSALRTATEELRIIRANLREAKKENSSTALAYGVTITRLDEIVSKCDEALKTGPWWSTHEVLGACERVFGKLEPRQATNILTALRNESLKPVPPAESEPTKPAA